MTGLQGTHKAKVPVVRACGLHSQGEAECGGRCVPMCGCSAESTETSTAKTAPSHELHVAPNSLALFLRLKRLATSYWANLSGQKLELEP